eukprot:550933-Prymnesium_polylepis.1
MLFSRLARLVVLAICVDSSGVESRTHAASGLRLRLLCFVCVWWVAWVRCFEPRDARSPAEVASRSPAGRQVA